ncbi:MAG: alpha-L-rhamnosidase N-terminal domain-containing protein [Phycisphaerales bacterium]
MDFAAKWIWNKQKSYKEYNRTIIARKLFESSAASRANLKITADSFYRLYINGKWVNDGPCRSWPEHYQYDEIDVTPHIISGRNEIKVIARYYGTGDFHRVPQQAGLLVQLEIELYSGKTKTIVSDDSWQVAPAKAWLSNTPKISIQMEPAEYYDARLEDEVDFSSAEVLFDAYDGKWKGLNRRDVALLTRKTVLFKSFLGAKIVKCEGLSYSFSPVRFFCPELIEANNHTSAGCGLATTLIIEKESNITIVQDGFKFAVNGVINPDGKYHLVAGSYIVLAFVGNVFDHIKDRSITFLTNSSLKLENPIDTKSENPWCLIPFTEALFLEDDTVFWWFIRENKEFATRIKKYLEQVEHFLSSVKDKKSFMKIAAEAFKVPPQDDTFTEDGYWQFRHRKEIGNGRSCVSNPESVIHRNGELIVNQSTDGDIELVYDFGEQCCGYYDFELVADEGIEIDIYGIEYITPTGEIQHTEGNRNGMRYITRKGVNSFTSLKRRSGRYIYITLRNQKTPVKFRRIQLIESIYPAQSIGSFSCSDAKLNKIWEISKRTLKLCMEDVFTDCPLYEQTLWVGDARNESLFGYYLFDSRDIAKRCINITAQSLERFPIVGGQVPSSWKCLLPAWSFLWGISVWEYYFYSGDIKFLKGIWKHVISNLKGAQNFLGKEGLFSAPFWNMFDWALIDQEHKTVLHNSMFLVGAIDVALKCASVLDDKVQISWLKEFRDNLCQAINKCWNPGKKTYPDSIHEDGSVSDSVSQHTSFLSVLYNIVENTNRTYALENILQPSDNTVRVGSPFAMFYLYEALEKIGREDTIIESIYKSYLPMLEVGATTVWEGFANGTIRNGKFPTRSHCHAWSAAPVYFLNRIILGIRQTEVGCNAFEVSPMPNGLLRAKGTVATIYGPISVEWSIDGKKMDIVINKPACIRVDVRENSSLNGIDVNVKMKVDAVRCETKHKLEFDVV